MKVKLFYSWTIQICFLTLLACGGGGGGSDQGGGETSRPETGFRVLNGNIDAPPVDVVIADTLAPSTKAIFSESSDWVSLNAGSQTVSLRRANTDAVLRSAGLTLSKGEVQSILLYGEASQFGTLVAKIDDTLPVVSAGNAAIRIVHAVVGAQQLSASAASVLISSATEFGSASSYKEVPAGDVILRTRRVSDGAVLFESTRTLEAGSAYTFFLSGEVGFLVASRLLKD